MRCLNKFVVVLVVAVMNDDGYIHASPAAAEVDTTYIYLFCFFFFPKKKLNQSYRIYKLDSIDGLSRRVEK
jgi:hypothetical protein